MYIIKSQRVNDAGVCGASVHYQVRVNVCELGKQRDLGSVAFRRMLCTWFTDVT